MDYQIVKGSICNPSREKFAGWSNRKIDVEFVLDGNGLQTIRAKFRMEGDIVRFEGGAFVKRFPSIRTVNSVSGYYDLNSGSGVITVADD